MDEKCWQRRPHGTRQPRHTLTRGMYLFNYNSMCIKQKERCRGRGRGRGEREKIQERVKKRKIKNRIRIIWCWNFLHYRNVTVHPPCPRVVFFFVHVGQLGIATCIHFIRKKKCLIAFRRTQTYDWKVVPLFFFLYASSNQLSGKKTLHH